jgi:hypothetical protein
VSRVVAVAALGTLSLAAWGAGAAGAAPVQRPSITVLTAAPNILAAHGGTVVVRVKVAHAVRCTFRGQRVAFAVAKLLRAVNCRSGGASLRIPIAANAYKHAVTLHFSVTASDTKSRHDYGSIQVVQAAKEVAPKAAPVPALSVDTTSIPAAALNQPYSVTFDASGGTAPYAWSLASGTLPPGVALSNEGELAGTPAAAGQYPFTVQAADATGHSQTAPFTINVADSTVTPAPAAPTVNSRNWSGYALTGGPFTSASGSFNVPAVTPSSVSSSTAEWVGIDGWGAGASSIIQAGIAQDYSATFGETRTYAWYELYPAPPFPLPMAVAAGDQVTVSISEVAAGSWDVLVKDATNGQSSNSEFSYGGIASTAEWIVEAPFSTLTQTVIPLLPFAPVTFTHLAATPTGAPASRFVMFQDGQQVSTPSPLSSNGFTVGYGGVTPGAP